MQNLRALSVAIVYFLVLGISALERNTCSVFYGQLSCPLIIIFFGFLGLSFFLSFVYLGLHKNAYALFCVAVISLFLVSGVNGYGAEKLFNGFVFPFLASLLIFSCVTSLDQLYKGLVWASALIFLYALLYKIAVDGSFFSRTNYYGMLGSITFGWVMGSAFLLTYMIEIRSKATFLALFGFGLLWSMSKGPIVALSVVLMVYVFFQKKGFQIAKFLSIFVVLISALYIYLPGHRVVSSFTRLLEASGDEIEETSSVAGRLSYYSDSFHHFVSSPLVGNGVGMWSEFTGNKTHEYPHNFVLEMLSEGGLMLLGSYALMVLYYFLKAPIAVRFITAFFLISLMFSGDLSYHRYYLVILFSGFLLFQQRRSGYEG